MVLLDLGLDEGSGDIPTRLHQLHAQLKEWCKTNKVQLHVNDLTRTILHFDADSDFPTGPPRSCSNLFCFEDLTRVCIVLFPIDIGRENTFLPLRGWFKGADTAAVCKFLEHKFKETLLSNRTEYIEAIYSACSASNEFLRCLYGADLFMPRSVTGRAAACGRKILEQYSKAASIAYSLSKTRFKLTPKYHLFCHVVMNLETAHRTRRFSLNPMAYSCQMDEDLVGRTSTMSKACSIRRVHEQTLRKYLVAVRLNLPNHGQKRPLPLSSVPEKPGPAKHSRRRP